MRSTKCRFFVAAIVSILGVSSSLSVFGQADEPFKLTELKIVNYNQYNNVFKDVSEEKDLEYWNSLGTSILVTAVVSAKPNTYVSGRKVKFEIYDGKKLIQTHSGRIGYFMSKNYYVPVMLYGPFCEPITIKARILGQKQSSSRSRTLNFACGE